MKLILNSLTALLLASALATAAPEKTDAKPGKPKASPEEAFKKLDKDGDGSLTLEEFKASGRFKKNPADADAAFAKKDTNKDSKLSLEEFKAGSSKKKEEAPKAEDKKEEKPAGQ